MYVFCISEATQRSVRSLKIRKNLENLIIISNAKLKKL